MAASYQQRKNTNPQIKNIFGGADLITDKNDAAKFGFRTPTYNVNRQGQYSNPNATAIPHQLPHLPLQVVSRLPLSKEVRDQS
jgi:hypothetical protein